MEVKTRTIDVYLTLHGQFKRYQTTNVISLEMPLGTTVEQVRSALGDYLLQNCKTDNGLDVQSLVANSHFAERGDLVADSYVLEKSTQLGVIPPL